MREGENGDSEGLKDKSKLFVQTINSSPRVHATVACFHGNMEHATEANRRWSFLRAATLYGFEYPGYGERRSEKPSEAAILADIPDIVDALSGSERVVVCGRSLGTFAALNLAVALGDKCVGVVLVSPMLTAIATKIPAPWYRALSFMDLLDNETTVKKLLPNVPVLIVHGDKDVVVPVWNGEALMSLLGPNSRIEVMENYSHNDIVVTEEFKKTVLSSIDTWIDA